MRPAFRRLILGTLACAPACPTVLPAQQPVDQGVRIGITYAPGTRPGLLVLGGSRNSAIDSVRRILGRDLDYSDQFEMIVLPGGDSLTLGVLSGEGGDSTEAFVNYPLYSALGANYAIDVAARSDSGIARVVLYNVNGETPAGEFQVPLDEPDSRRFRMAIHEVADRITRRVVGTPGIAASRLLWVRDDALWIVDSDGYAEVRVPVDGPVYSPVWHPDGGRLAYSQFPETSRIYVYMLETGNHEEVEAPTGTQDFAPAFAPDGETLAFARSSEDGTDLYSYNFRDDCCLQRLTVGRFSDNLSPTFSPDGRRIAYVSTRPGLPQIYVMAADGTGQELFAPFDFGVTGGSYAPEWSPDGLSLAFHRDVEGTPQVFIMDVAARNVRQLTSAGRNEDPTWAPDGRHLAFVSSRTGTRQIWVIDLETGRTRQLTSRGNARLPSWSGRIEGN